MSESLRNDGRVWVPRNANDTRQPGSIPEEDRYYYLEERYPSFGNLVPRDVASRNAKQVCDQGLGVGATGRAVFLDFRDAINRLGENTIRDRYGNLFQMYDKIAGDDPYNTPMRIYPAVHYTMGGLWVDYNLMSNIPGLFVLGEANFSDHGANRLGASALMQGLADGYFVAPSTVPNYLANYKFSDLNESHSAFKDVEGEVQGRIDEITKRKGGRSVTQFHRELGRIMWDEVGIARNKQGLESALDKVRSLREEYKHDVKVLGDPNSYNKELERAMRVSDFLEFAEVKVYDALHREESCGCHLREEYQTEEGEALRNDDDFSYVAAWEYKGAGNAPELHKEPLTFEYLEIKQRSYK